MEPLSLQAGEKSNRRRSQRVLLSVPVVVSAPGGDKQLPSEDTRTLVVNAHGALVLLRMKLTVGQLLTLKNAKTEEEVSCRVVYSSQNLTGKSEVGVEFIKPAPNFWRIAFPPDDWSQKSPDAKRFSPPPGQKESPLPKK
jgi:hypothetical protein